MVKKLIGRKIRVSFMNKQEKIQLREKDSYYKKQDWLGAVLSWWRNKKVLPFIHGVLVDVACGDNRLVKWYGKGTGVDIVGYETNITVVNDLEDLPFQTDSIDTVTIIASLNYFHDPEAVLREIHRILCVTGSLVLTMSNSSVMKIWHKFREPYAYQHGYSEEQLKKILNKAGFVIKKKKFFMVFLNAIYVAEKIK